MNLSELSIEELKQLAINIKQELNERISSIKAVKKDVAKILDKSYYFYFKTECRTHEKGYVAKYLYDKNEKNIKREFYNCFEETKFGGNLVIEGNFVASELDILDIRYRNIEYGNSAYYIVLNGKLEKLCELDDIHKISSIKRYLKGEIEFENFLEIIGLKEIKVGVIDELLEN